MDQFELLNSIDQLPEGCDPSTVLCTLYGPFADYSVPTENGYWYSSELYDKVLESNQYKEFIANRVNFAEGDHPSDQENRSSIYLPKVSHAYRDVVNDKANKRVMGKIDILDTPDGRVLYTLVKYGANSYLLVRCFTTELHHQSWGKKTLIKKKSKKISS